MLFSLQVWPGTFLIPTTGGKTAWSYLDLFLSLLRAPSGSSNMVPGLHWLLSITQTIKSINLSFKCIGTQFYFGDQWFLIFLQSWLRSSPCPGYSLTLVQCQKICRQHRNLRCGCSGSLWSCEYGEKWGDGRKQTNILSLRHSALTLTLSRIRSHL